jgi:hypothetical protein
MDICSFSSSSVVSRTGITPNDSCFGYKDLTDKEEIKVDLNLAKFFLEILIPVSSLTYLLVELTISAFRSVMSSCCGTTCMLLPIVAKKMFSF